MSKTVISAWKEGRRRSARSTILEAAWAAVHQDGLGGLSMRDLAQRAGVTTPTLYAYFESKHDIYDAMFGEAAQLFEQRMSEPTSASTPRQLLVDGARRFAAFCTEDVERYQLLFQRVIPGFEPSAQSYAYSLSALEKSKRRLASIGITGRRRHDMWTALLTGLVDQQISNDPGGDRWTRLTEDVVDMFLAYCQADREERPRDGRATRTKGS